MKVITARDELELDDLAADIIEETVRCTPGCCLGLATGTSYVGVYRKLIERYSAGRLSFAGVRCVNLDEYAGLPQDHPQSFRSFLEEHLLRYVDVDPNRVFVASGMGDLDENVREFADYLSRYKRDLQLLGVGANGHIGFNEPGKSLHDGAHREKLLEKTRRDNARFFPAPKEVPYEAITMGIGDILRARRILLIIKGEKEQAAKELLCGDRITSECPVTFLKLHSDITVLMTEDMGARVIATLG